MLRFLDHLEEWMIATMMGGATLIIFVAVLHRYAAGLPIPVVQDALLAINLSWAQELCIYMFIWMAKFGAAYGVRTGIHVGVDVLINALPAPARRAYVDAGADAVRRAELRHPDEHVDAKLLRPRQVDPEECILHDGDRQPGGIAVEDSDEDDERGTAHHRRNDPFFKVIEKAEHRAGRSARDQGL